MINWKFGKECLKMSQQYAVIHNNVIAPEELDLDPEHRDPSKYDESDINPNVMYKCFSQFLTIQFINKRHDGHKRRTTEMNDLHMLVTRHLGITPRNVEECLNACPSCFLAWIIEPLCLTILFILVNEQVLPVPLNI